MQIGVDIGGTFTDLVCIDDSARLHTAKTPSIPDDPSSGVLEGLSLLAKRMTLTLQEMLNKTDLFIHGSTVATNLVVERKGARLGLITTAGFRDVIELRDGSKQNRYNIRMAPPNPLIERPNRLEVNERVTSEGEIERSLDEDAVRTAIEILQNKKVEGLVVLFLHAHRNGVHENRVREIIAETGWAPFVSLSHEVLRRDGEYDRVSTAAVNAYVGPGLGGYLERLAATLSEEGLAAPVLVMQSTGGVLPLDHAVQHAVGAVTSGPAGGAMAGALFAKLTGEPRVVTYDMGGTSTDICLIEDGKPLERQETQLGEVKIAIPALDISALGAGGGSIAWVDPGGILDLGPHSAGALPGPACYDQGGTQPTLTDANLILGFITPETFLGGRLALSRSMAAKAVDEHIAQPLGMSVEEAALAINALASARIAEGMRANTVRRGLDPREFAIFSFGGAGGLHAAAVAQELEIPRAIIPREAAVLSALGFLATDVRHDYQRVVGNYLLNLQMKDVRQPFFEMVAEAMSALDREGFNPDQIRFTRIMDCRYVRQVYTLPIEVSGDAISKDDDIDWIAEAFEKDYGALYRHVHERSAIVVDTVRLVAYGILPSLSLPQEVSGEVEPSSAQRGTRMVYRNAMVELPCYWFEDLTPGMKLTGPAMVDSESTTVFIPDFSVAGIDPYGSLIITPLEQPS
ncbi:MAG: Acetophenone carboxylase gamma subunit [Alphaproteobacteria bacterium MarineAlpha4_Bin2]|nr:MAG: Acetophenone carboxylase gamma subunit [Alphaproteobacteria bacterium MarineAlpha4_Bin2]